MGSIRPLFTITVLVVVGAYLYVKINEGPARPLAVGDAQAGVPPLAAAGGGATLAQDSAAPAWPPAASAAAPAAPVLPPGAASPGNASADSDPAKNGLPEVPPIPELPELPKTADVTPPAAPLPQDLPANIPDALPPMTANSTDAAGIANAPTPPGSVPGTPASENAANVWPNTPNIGVSGGIPSPLPNDPAGSASTLQATSAPPLTTGLPSAEQTNPLRGAAPTTPANTQSDDRYGFGASQTPQPATITPAAGEPSTLAGATFAASWPAIQAALDRNDLKQSHQLLSKWHNDESLSPVDAQKVESLLGQLAGTVIYSTEHQLEPARVVKPGETLETIAKEFNVPWQLLAKINSIPAPEQVRLGQELKVIRGPFSAVVDLRRGELTLEVDGRYAGTFPVSVPPGITVTEGQWLVDQKLSGTQNSIAPAAYAAAPPTADRTIVLRNASTVGAQPGGPSLMIASGASPAGPSAGGAAIRVAPQDAEELSDILSIGSRVVVRR